ncbi:competence protein ComK [Paenibacillus taichungensis]
MNKNTLALIPKWDEKGNLNTEVFESKHTFVADGKPNEIIKNSMLYYGTEYNGVRQATKEMMGYSYRIPICISLPLGIYTFPLNSSKSDASIWLMENQILSFTQIEKGSTTVNFYEGISLTIDYPVNLIKNSIKRTTEYRQTLLTRNQ